jgi:hypothetical protein
MCFNVKLVVFNFMGDGHMQNNRDLEANVAAQATAQVSITASMPVTLLGNSGSRHQQNDSRRFIKSEGDQNVIDSNNNHHNTNVTCALL